MQLQALHNLFNDGSEKLGTLLHHLAVPLRELLVPLRVRDRRVIEPLATHGSEAAYQPHDLSVRFAD